MLIYFTKTILLFGIFFMLYLVFLKNNKTFKWNRAYLIISSVLAILLPLIQHIHLFQKEIITQTNKPIAVTLETINVYANNIQAQEFNFAKIIFGIYAVGLIWGLLRMILGFIVINRVKVSSQLEKIGNELIYFNTNIESPFSFNSNIYIPQKFKEESVLQTIIKHEQAHVQLKHSRDKIYFSLLQALFWFNPFVYFYHKEIELVHEFEADEFSIQEIATDEYVENLLQTISYTQTPTLLAHHFFHHPLKTRITMLYTKSKSAIAQKSTVIISGIIICLSVLFLQSYGQKKKAPEDFSKMKVALINPENPNQSMSFTKISKTPDSLFNKSNVDLIPTFIGGETELKKFIDKNKSNLPKLNKNVSVQFTIHSDGSISKKIGIEPFFDKKEYIENIEHIFSVMPKWKPGLKNGKPVAVIMNIEINY